jgi:hypothetical protein
LIGSSFPSLPQSAKKFVADPPVDAKTQNKGIRIMKRITYALFSAFLLLAVAGTASSQIQVASTGSDKSNREGEKPKKNDKKDTAEKDEVTAAPQTSSDSKCESCRWFEPTAATFSMRYRTTTDTTNDRMLNQGQQRTILAGKFKFDREGKYTVNVHASSGYYFNWAYADTGMGNTVNEVIRKAAPGMAPYVVPELAPAAIQQAVSGYIAANFPGATPDQIAQLTPVLTAQFTPIVSEQIRLGLIQELSNTDTRTKGWNLYVRQLYFQAKPVRGLEFSYGSLPINKGVNTEATSYDDDGYVSGGRVSVKRPKDYWFDEMSATYGYLGDIFTPNFFRRTERFGQANYYQLLLRKKFNGGKIDVSTDYTFQTGTDTMRQAVLFNVKGSKVFDTVRVEAYQRIGDNIVNGKIFNSGAGFYVQGEKKLFDRLTLNGGVASVDRHYTVYGEYDTATLDWFGFAINGDQTGLGKRFVGKANYKLTKDLGVSMLYSQTFANDPAEMRYYWNKTHFNVALTYDILKGVKRLGWFK